MDAQQSIAYNFSNYFKPCFIITNFGVWQATDIYEKSPEGLLTCYIAAIPFFANTILSTFFYLILIKFLLKSFAEKFKTV